MIHVIDASALLAVARDENGANVVLDLINTEECVVSSVNLAEVASKLIDLGLPTSELHNAIAQFNVDAIDFSQEQVIVSAEIRPITKAIGLSLGDRACIALAKLMNGCAVTADKAWSDIAEPVGVSIIIIR
jgi:ribonuclease VapC